MKDALNGPWRVRREGVVQSPRRLLEVLRYEGNESVEVASMEAEDWISLSSFRGLVEHQFEQKARSLWHIEPQRATGGGTKSAAPAPREPVDQDQLASVLKKLEALHGLERAKHEILQIISLIQVSKKREAMGLSGALGSFHAVFAGNPGTGKTTFARIYGEALAALGVIKSDAITEVTRADLVAGYVGQTAIKMREVIGKAGNGVLFVDEAYALVNGDDDSFGHEALAELIKAMEDRRESMVVVLAGYTADMDELLSSNPGLRSRVLSTVHFDDYSTDDLAKIAIAIARSRQFELDDGAIEALKSAIDAKRAKADARDFGNAREARNAIDRMVRAHAIRVAGLNNPSAEELTRLRAEDLL